MFVISVMSLTQDLMSARFRHQCLVNRSVTVTSPITCLSASSDLSSWHRELPTHYSIRLFCIHTRCHRLLTHFSVQLFCIHTRCHLTSTHISILVVQHHCIHGPLMPLSINTSLIQLFSIRTKMPPLTNTCNSVRLCRASQQDHPQLLQDLYCRFFRLVISFIQDLTNSRFHLKFKGGVRDILAHETQT
jgi:hypothetical protein